MLRTKEKADALESVGKTEEAAKLRSKPSEDAVEVRNRTTPEYAASVIVAELQV
ncbi:MAG: hypothetical protein QMC36_04390 [Patescibacteria group bacterium]